MSRVAIALHHLDLLGQFMGLIKELKKRGHKVAVFNHTIMSNFQEFIPVRCEWIKGDLKAIEDFAPDVVLLWNGRYWYLKQVSEKLRRTFPGKVRVVEFGWFPQKGSLTIANDICHLSTMPRILKARALEDEPSWRKVIIPTILAAQDRYPKPGLDSELPSKFVFIPFQLEADTQITECSPYIKKMNDLVSQVRKLVGEDFPIVYKQHPKCSTEGSGPIAITDERAVEYKGKLTSFDLALRCTFIAGINSTLLSEAMLFDVPGITFGTYNNGTFYYRLTGEGIITNMHGQEIKERGNELALKLMSDFYNDKYRRLRGLAHVVSWQFPKDEVPDWVVDAVFHPDGAAHRRLSNQSL